MYSNRLISILFPYLCLSLSLFPWLTPVEIRVSFWLQTIIYLRPDIFLRFHPSRATHEDEVIAEISHGYKL